MIIKPLPRNLLIHKIIYKEYVGDNGWDDNYKDGVTIENVRIEANTEISRSSDSIQKVKNYTIFVDAKHSTQFPDFKAFSQVIWVKDEEDESNNVEYEISQVNPVYAADPLKPHHYELVVGSTKL